MGAHRGLDEVCRQEDERADDEHELDDLGDAPHYAHGEAGLFAGLGGAASAAFDRSQTAAVGATCRESAEAWGNQEVARAIRLRLPQGFPCLPTTLAPPCVAASGLGCRNENFPTVTSCALDLGAPEAARAPLCVIDCTAVLNCLRLSKTRCR